MPIIFAAAGVLSVVLGGIVFVGYFIMRKAYMHELAKQESPIINEGQTPSKYKDLGGTSGVEVARDLNSQLSAKTIVLEKLIADSQKQIDRMEQLLDQIEAARRDG
jgi:uncharacterized protein YneF (UPF0154 family)